MLTANEGWKSAFMGALLIHLGVAVFSLFAPQIWQRPRQITPVYTVKLFESVERTESPPGMRKKTAPPASRKKEPRHKAAKKQKVTPSPPKKKTISKPQKALSLNPEKKQKKKKTKKEKKRKQDTDKLLKQRITKIQKRVKERKNEAILAERLSALKQKVRSKQKEAGGQARSARPGAGREASDEVLRLYIGRLMNAVREHWSFPEHLYEGESLKAVVVIRIADDGRLIKAWFEQKSGKTSFDQSTMRAVKTSNIPSLPMALRPGPLEIGLIFTPGEIGT